MQLFSRASRLSTFLCVCCSFADLLVLTSFSSSLLLDYLGRLTVTLAGKIGLSATAGWSTTSDRCSWVRCTPVIWGEVFIEKSPFTIKDVKEVGKCCIAATGKTNEQKKAFLHTKNQRTASPLHHGWFSRHTIIPGVFHCWPVKLSNFYPRKYLAAYPGSHNSELSAAMWAAEWKKYWCWTWHCQRLVLWSSRPQFSLKGNKPAVLISAHSLGSWAVKGYANFHDFMYSRTSI